MKHLALALALSCFTMAGCHAMGHAECSKGCASTCNNSCGGGCCDACVADE